MSYSANDKSRSSGQPVEFFKFESSFGDFYYTTDPEPASCGGEDYLPMPGGISRGPIETSAITDSISTVDVTFPANSDVAQALCLHKTPEFLKVEIRRAHRGDNWDTDFSIEWVGFGGVTSIDAHTATIKTGSLLQAKLRGHTAAILYQRMCNHRIYDARCGVSKPDWTLSSVVTEIRSQQITVQNQGTPNGDLALGEMRNTRTGESRVIHDNQNNVISVSYRFMDIQIGDVVEMSFGCNRLRLGHCKNRFNNNARYGGFDWIPEENPFTQRQSKEIVTTTNTQSWRPPPPPETPPTSTSGYGPPSSGSAGASVEIHDPFARKNQQTPQPSATKPTLRNSTGQAEKAVSIRGNFPASDIGLAIPFLLGRRRVSKPNAIWYGNPQTIYQTTRSTEVVDLGNGVSENRETVTRSPVGLRADLQFGICLGPDVKLRAIYAGDLSDPIWEGNVGPARTEFVLPSTPNTSFSGRQIAFSGGSFNQEPDPWYSVSMPFDSVPANMWIGQGYVDLGYEGRKRFFYGYIRNQESVSPGQNRMNVPTIGGIDHMANGWQIAAFYEQYSMVGVGVSSLHIHFVGDTRSVASSVDIQFTTSGGTKTYTMMAPIYSPDRNETVYRNNPAVPLDPPLPLSPYVGERIPLGVSIDGPGILFSDMPGYVGIAYAIIKQVRVDTNLVPIQFEVERFTNPFDLLPLRNRYKDDINPSTAIFDVMTNDWGGGSLDPAYIDRNSLIAAAETFKDEDNYCSLLIEKETPVINVLGNIQSQTYSLIYHRADTGLLELVPVRAKELSYGLAVKFGQGTILNLQNLEKGDWASTWSTAKGVYVERTNHYEPTTLLINTTAQATNDFLERRGGELDYPYVTNPELCMTLLTRDMALSVVPRFTCSLEVTRIGAQLSPGSVCLVDWPNFQFWGVPMVVSKVRKLPMSSNTVIVQLEQYTTPDMQVIDSLPGGSDSDVFGLESVPPSHAMFLTAPFWLARERGLITSANISDIVFPVVLPAPANSVQASFRALMENMPGAAKTTIVEIGTYPTYGELNSAISRGDGFTTGVIPSVILRGIVNDGNLENMSATRQRDGSALMFINNEILTFETANYLGSAQWELGNVRRALIDTVVQDHAIGSQVYISTNPFSCIGGTPFNRPLTFAPIWRLVSNSVNEVGRDDNATIVPGWSPTNSRTMAPPRPHDTKIDGVRSTIPPTLPIGSSVSVQWKTRTRSVSTLRFQSDPAEDAESLNSQLQFHRVYLRDSNNVLHLCGTTASDTTYNDLTVNIPLDAAPGAGRLFVRSVNSVSESVNDDWLPVNIWHGSDIQLRYALSAT